MTARFDAFKAALEALCVEHGMHIYADYDGQLWASDGEGFGDIEDDTRDPPTPEEIAAEEALRTEAQARWSEKYRAIMAMRAEFERDRGMPPPDSPSYIKWTTCIEQDAIAQRKKQMRVSTDPTDPAYIDARARKAWCNDVLIEGWTVADEFRRVVITPAKVYHGSVRIERLPEWVPAPEMVDGLVQITKEFEAAIAPPIEWPQIEEPAPLPPITSLPRVKQETRKRR